MCDKIIMTGIKLLNSVSNMCSYTVNRKIDFQITNLRGIVPSMKVHTMSESEIPTEKYEQYGTHENVYARYELSEEDQILRDMNTKYSTKGAWVALGLVTAGFSTAAIVMSQKWVPNKPIEITTTVASSTSRPADYPADPDQVRLT